MKKFSIYLLVFLIIFVQNAKRKGTNELNTILSLIYMCHVTKTKHKTLKKIKFLFYMTILINLIILEISFF